MPEGNLPVQEIRAIKISTQVILQENIGHGQLGKLTRGPKAKRIQIAMDYMD